MFVYVSLSNLRELLLCYTMQNPSKLIEVPLLWYLQVIIGYNRDWTRMAQALLLSHIKLYTF